MKVKLTANGDYNCQKNFQEANWSCGEVPDSNMDVIINSSIVVLKSITAVRSLKVSASAKFTVNTGYNITVMH